jgi:hypothetical protein
MRDRFLPATEKAIKGEIGYLLNHSSDFITLRNSLAHCSWQSNVRGSYNSAKVIRMRESHEKFMARIDNSITPEYLNAQSKELRKLNVRAQKLILKISTLRGIPPSEFHHPKYLN